MAVGILAFFKKTGILGRKIIEVHFNIDISILDATLLANKESRTRLIGNREYCRSLEQKKSVRFRQKWQTPTSIRSEDQVNGG